MGAKGFSIAVLCGSVVAGCVTVLPPLERLASSEESVRAASEAGAGRVKPAARYLTLAEQELANARELIDVGENDRAELLLLRAQADAELAYNIAKYERDIVAASAVARPPPPATADAPAPKELP